MRRGLTTAPAASARIGAIAICGIGALIALCAIAAITNQAPFSEYLEQARRCVELNDCPSRGGLTELGPIPLYHGTSWIRLLTYSLRSGADLTRVQSVVLGLWLLSIPVVCMLFQRYLGWRTATLGLALYFPVVLVGTDIHFLTYTNLTPLPFALYYLAIALFVEFRSTAWAALASIALAAAVSAELGSIVMVPFHFALVALVAPAPLRGVAICALALVVPFCLDSLDAALEIVRQAPTLRFAAAVAISAGIVGSVAALGSSRVLRMPLAARLRTVMAAALIYPTMAVWLACVLLRRSLPAPQYLAPAGVPFLYLVAARTGGLERRQVTVLVGCAVLALVALALAPQTLGLLQLPVMAIVTVFALAILVERIAGRTVGVRWPIVGVCVSAIVMSAAALVWRAHRDPAQAITLAEADPVVSRLYAAGYSYPQLLAALQGPAADDLMSLATARDPNIFAPPAHLVDPDFSLLVAKVADATIPRLRDLVAAIPVGGGRSIAVVRGDRPYLDWLRMRRCGWSHGEGPPSVDGCAAPAIDASLPHNWPYVRFGDPIPWQRNATDEAATVVYQVPVHTPGRGRAHVVRLPSEWPATWAITRVSGVDFTGTLPGAEIRLTDQRAASGIVELTFTSPLPGDLPWVWRPHGSEVDEEQADLLVPRRADG